jgi:hypothetical protein
MVLMIFCAIATPWRGSALGTFLAPAAMSLIRMKSVFQPKPKKEGSSFDSDLYPAKPIHSNHWGTHAS